MSHQLQAQNISRRRNLNVQPGRLIQYKRVFLRQNKLKLLPSKIYI